MNISEEVKNYLNRKLEDCEKLLNELRNKRKRIKLLYIITVLLSIITSAVLTVISAMTTVPVIVITVLAAFSAILTAIGARFNLHDKKAEINNWEFNRSRIWTNIEKFLTIVGALSPLTFFRCRLRWRDTL